jgi:glucose/arabinose dehydrogenase
MVAQPADSADLYVVEKGGKIKIIRSGTVLSTPFADIGGLSNTADEGGLLGLAFAPDFATSGNYYVYLTAGNNSIVRAYPSGTDLVSMSTSGYNVGGTVAWGPDGKLWVAVGDSDLSADAQDLTSRHGKMLRLDPSGAAATDNLGGADTYVWDYGLRNPFRFSFDRDTHDLYLGDAGDTAFEEVDVEPPNMGHHDYGWDRMEGMHCHGGGSSCGAAGTLPVYERPHDAAYSVLIGGYVYRGIAMPCLRGRYLFSIFGTGHLLSFEYDGYTVSSQTELSDSVSSNVDLSQLVGFGEVNDGELYLVTMDGHVYKLVPG